MNKMTGSEIRQKWLDFFKSKGHYVVESKSLVPVNDNSLLWINAGIATLKNYFSGKSIPPAPRLTNSQRCLRTNDIENVGVTSRHQTLFEMLGNFAIGDYFKKEAIEFAYDLLVNHYGLQKDKLYITVFEDDNDAYQHWIDLSIDPSHIIKCGKDRNFWDLGQGPCGPCTEIYYDRGEKYDRQKVGFELFKKDIENDRYIEIWNIVFSQFNNDGNNNYTELARKNIDTGSGLERLASVLQDVPTNFDSDLFLPIIKEIEKFSNQTYNIEDYFSDDKNIKKVQTAFRVMADHIKAVVFAISDGVVPGPKGRNYIIRRLIRRAVINARKLNVKNGWASSVIDVVIKIYGDFFTHLQDKKEIIFNTLVSEIESYTRTMENAFNLFNEEIKNNTLSTQSFFKLVETYGLPAEFAKEFLEDSAEKIQEVTNAKINLAQKINWKEFDQLFKQHQMVSKSGSQNISAIEKQNPNLLNCHVQSHFDYNEQKTTGQVVALFDDEFNPQTKIENNSGYVVFDKTVIYATSGGQRFDEGYAQLDDNVPIKFDAIFKGPNLQHLHHFNDASFEIGQKWTIWHDPEWRLLVRKNHSLEHILHSALKKVISSTIKQEGAFKSAEKATLDFSYPTKLTDDQLTAIENEIRHVIAQKIPVEIIYTDLEGSKRLNAIAYFDDEYKKHDQLRVIKISDYSVELCGGTHVSNTSEIENCFIMQHTSHGTGSWRIEIISSHQTIQKYLQEQNTEMQSSINEMIELTKTMGQQELLSQLSNFQLPQEITQLRACKQKFKQLINTYKELKMDFDKKQAQLVADNMKTDLLKSINNGYAIISVRDQEAKKISVALSNASNEQKDVIFAIVNTTPNKTQYFVAIKNSSNNKTAKNIVQLLNQKYQGNGGGKDNYAQGGSDQQIEVNEIAAIIESVR